MDKKWQHLLINLGFSEKEARIYLAAYCLGMTTVVEIARKTSLKRTTIYPIIESLKKKGLLFQSKRGKKSYLVAGDPELLLNTLEKNKNQISQMIPKLRKERVFSELKPKVTFYTGRVGFKRVREEIFASKEKEFLIITQAKDFSAFISEKSVGESIIQKKLKLGIKSRQIITDSIYARKIVTEDVQENRISKIAPVNFPFVATEIIFGDKLAVISTKFEDLIMIIESSELARTHRSYFELIWRSI